jgi:hypothetical protein
MRRNWTIAAAVALALPLLSTGTAHAAIVTYSGQDDGASTSGPWPLSTAAQASFEAAAVGYGTLTTQTYESATVGFYSPIVLPGVTITLTGTDLGNGLSGISNTTGGSLDGFNVTPGGSQFLGMSLDTATFTFSSPTNSFGTWMTGLQTYYSGTDGVEITFNDGSSELLEPPINVNGGAQYFGFTDTSAFTSVTITNTGNDGYYDYWGIDDTTFNTSAVTAVPEPTTLALFGSVLAGLALARRRRGMQSK